MGKKHKDRAFQHFLSGGDAVSLQTEGVAKSSAYRYFKEFLIIQISRQAFSYRDNAEYWAKKWKATDLKKLYESLKNRKYLKSFKKSELSQTRALERLENESLKGGSLK